MVGVCGSPVLVLWDHALGTKEAASLGVHGVIKQQQTGLPSYQAFLSGSAIHIELDDVIMPCICTQDS